MPDISAIAAALSALKGAKDIAESMVALRDTAAFQGKLIEFQSKIIDANNAAFAAQEERAAMLERVGDLEKEVANLKAWDAEKQRYQMQQVWPGATTYVLKEDAKGPEPIHWLCAACYQAGEKGVLQLTEKSADSAGRLRGWGCPRCKALIYARYDVLPGKPAAE